MKYKRVVSFLLSVLTTTIFSCKKLVPEARVPTYLQIDSFAYKVNSVVDTSESKSHHIENVWVYANNIFIGAFVLPAKIPVLNTGKVNFLLRPGIKQNGISNTRIAYPFYQSYETTLNLVGGETIKIPATTHYYDFTHFAFNEYFEKNIVRLERLVSGTGVNIIRTTEGTRDIFEGGDSGEIILKGADTLCEIATKTQFPLPISSKDVYLELDYKTPISFTFGLVAYSTTGTNTQDIFTFNPSTDINGNIVWKKIYIDMAPEIGNNSTAIDYKIYFYATKTIAEADAHIYLDNIKVVHTKQ